MELDINTLRSLATVVSFITFVGIVAWAYSRRNAADFDEAANLPFEQRLTKGIQGKKMSDFTSNFWAMWVSGITVASILACLLLLWFSGKAKAMTADDNTTGHVWDGDLREMNNPLPRWWAWLFVHYHRILFCLSCAVSGFGYQPWQAGVDIGWSASGGS
jgi:cbb3-type cytochrome oxidase subunit 3